MTVASKIQEKTSDINILVAEDEYLYQEIIQRYVKVLDGLRLTIVDNGHKCIAKAKEQSYDVILMDIVMPGKDGYETTKEIRKIGINTPIIAITANIWPEDELHSRKSGMNDFLPKPFNAQKLAGKINYWIKNREKTA